MKSLYWIFSFILCAAISYGQIKIEPTFRASNHKAKPKQLNVNPKVKQLQFGASNTHKKSIRTHQTHLWNKKSATASDVQVIKDPISKEVIAIKGETIKLKSVRSAEAKSKQHLQTLSPTLLIKDTDQELKLIDQKDDKKGNVYMRYQQEFKGIKILDSQITTHQKNGHVNFVNGRWNPTPENINIKETISKHDAQQIVIQDLDKFMIVPDHLQRLVNHQQITIEKVIVFENKIPALAWHIDIFETISDRWEYTIDAHSGDILNKHSTVCHFHDHGHSHEPNEATVNGKTSSTARDLSGEIRNINIYECGNAFFLADAGRTMFHGNESDCTNDDLLIHGVIITWDALGNSPTGRNFQYNYSISTNKNVWDDPRAISAHYNGGSAYEYFKNTFGRESINGDRGNIESFYNVSDENGQQMDNAFWTGAAIFYGNGKQAFRQPLSAGLDVAGHEMSHGVVQTTANLRYEGESGALNESFADVFGTMIERETWEIGEDVVNPQIFPTGALRNMADPNNGGRQLGDPGFQPASVREQFFGREDNGGVHINSGIPNRAYYLFASNDNVGIQIAEQVYYKVLTQYLTPRSQFIDLRTAVIQAASEDYGNVVADAAIAAFDAVGIVGTGVVRPSTQDRELESNTGDLDLILWSDLNQNTIHFSTNTGNNTGISFDRPHISKPSVTDDGSRIVFTNANNQAQYIQIDWATGNIVEEFVLFDGVRNVVISKDGTKVAALTGDLTTGDFNNLIYVIDLISGEQQAFELFNPTFTEGISTGEVFFADAMEFDHAGENILYDSFNSLQGNQNLDVRYWDIGIMTVWNNANGTFSTEQNNIYKVFNGLPENVSIGNPTFSKNNPDVIAFDYREIDVISQDTVFEILGANMRTGDVETIFENNTWGYPNYSVDDSDIIFSVDDAGIGFIIGIQGITDSRINATGNAARFIRDLSQWGVWFGTGTRDLISNTEDVFYDEIEVFPNPATDILNIALPDEFSAPYRVEIFNIDGQVALRKTQNQNSKELTLDIHSLHSGTYVLKLIGQEKLYTQKFMVLD